MSIYNMDKLFKPSSVAIIGASDQAGSTGSSIFRNLINGGFEGKLYPVNPETPVMWNGTKGYASVLDIGEAVDLVILATPLNMTPALIQECSQAGAGSAIIFSTDVKETLEERRLAAEAIRKEVTLSGIRVIGPNCVGLVCSESKLYASPASHLPGKGKMAFVSQSGSIYSSILDLSIKENLGFSYFVSLGSMVDIEFGDMIDYLGNEPDVSSIVMFVETLTRFRNFMSAARSVSRIKPIILLKAGRTQAGARAVTSHTGAFTGDDAIYDAAFKRAGIVRVRTFEELFDCSELLSRQPKVTGPGLAIITNAGGPGIMAADALTDYGVEPVALKPETLGKLDSLLSPRWSHGNPIDILGDASPERYQKAVEICMGATEVNGILVILSPNVMANPTQVAETLVDIFRKKPFPVFTSWMGGMVVEKGRAIFNQSNISTFDTPERAVRAFMDLYRYSKNIELLQENPVKFPKVLEFDDEKARDIVKKGLETSAKRLTEMETKSLLSSYGIPVNRMKVAYSESEAVQMAREIGFPIVMKINSRDIVHKTEACCVRLRLENDFEVREAFNEISENAKSYAPDARLDGVSIQPMLSSLGYELMMAARKDRNFGPVILFGMGGVMTEILNDKAIALPPLNRLLARRLMEETRIFHILKGFRGYPPVNLVMIEEILIRFSQLVADFPEIDQLEMNPLIVTQNEAYVVDASAFLSAPADNASRHMVISPYPNQYEGFSTSKDGVRFFIRPIRPDDASLLVELFEALSPRSVYMRFYSSLKRLPPSMLARFTQVDYDRTIALVAILEQDKKEKMIGVARVIAEPDPRHAEFAVLIEDKWQGKGIGAELLKRCLDISREQGIEKVHGMVLAENTQMIALGKKMGFTIQRNLATGDFELLTTLSGDPAVTQK